MITKTPLDPETFGGYVNVSEAEHRPDAARASSTWSSTTSPAQYAIETEDEAGHAVSTPRPTPGRCCRRRRRADIAAAIWGAVGAAFAAIKGQGAHGHRRLARHARVIGPLFPGINPANAYGVGFSAADFGQGQQAASRASPWSCPPD